MEFDWTKTEKGNDINSEGVCSGREEMDAQLKILLRWTDNKEDEAYLLAEETNRLYKTVFKRLCNNYADKLN